MHHIRVAAMQYQCYGWIGSAGREPLQHPRKFAHPQCHLGFGEDCTHKSHSQMYAVEELTVNFSSNWATDKQARDLASGNHHQLTSEKGSSPSITAPPRLPVVPQ